MTGLLTSAARAALYRARQYGDVVVLNCTATVAQELLAARLVSRTWMLDAAGRVAWTLTPAGRALREQLRDTPERRAAQARAKAAAARWLHTVSSGQHGHP